MRTLLLILIITLSSSLANALSVKVKHFDVTPTNAEEHKIEFITQIGIPECYRGKTIWLRVPKRVKEAELEINDEKGRLIFVSTLGLLDLPPEPALDPTIKSSDKTLQEMKVKYWFMAKGFHGFKFCITESDLSNSTIELSDKYGESGLVTKRWSLGRISEWIK